MSFAQRFLATEKSAAFAELQPLYQTLKDLIAFPMLGTLSEFEIELLTDAAELYLQPEYEPIKYRGEARISTHEYFLCHKLSQAGYIKRTATPLGSILEKIENVLIEDTLTDNLRLKPNDEQIRHTWGHDDSTPEDTMCYIFLKTEDGKELVRWPYFNVIYVNDEATREDVPVNGYVLALLRLMWIDYILDPMNQLMQLDSELGL